MELGEYFFNRTYQKDSIQLPKPSKRNIKHHVKLAGTLNKFFISINSKKQEIGGFFNDPG